MVRKVIILFAVIVLLIPKKVSRGQTLTAISTAIDVASSVWSPGKSVNAIERLAGAAGFAPEGVREVEKLQKTARAAVQTKRVIEKLYTLQKRTEQRLKNVESVKDLLIGDVKSQVERILGISLDPSTYIPNVPPFNEMIEMNRFGSGGVQPMFAYNSIHPHRLSTLTQSGPGQLESKDEEERAANVARIALKEHVKRQKLQMARVLDSISGTLIKKNMELANALKKEEFLKMGEGERMNLMNEVNNNLDKYVDYQSRAVKLMDEAAEPIEEMQNYITARKIYLRARQMRLSNYSQEGNHGDYGLKKRHHKHRIEVSYSKSGEKTKKTYINPK